MLLADCMAVETCAQLLLLSAEGCAGGVLWPTAVLGCSCIQQCAVLSGAGCLHAAHLFL
jgi:hypothetical protein